MGWIITIILGGLAGWIAEKIMGSEHGLLTNIVLGIVGAAVLNFILGTLFGLYAADTWLAYLIVAIIGACGLIFTWRAISGRS